MVSPTLVLSSGLAELKRLLADLSATSTDLNEADTRHRFIDRLLHDCLGWDRSETHVERRLGDTYSDYELGRPPRVLVEAKRAGATFSIPHEHSPRVLRSLRSLTSASREFREAFLQATTYCAQRGIQICVVATSSQVVVSLGVRSDGVPVGDGKCLVFDGHGALVEHFPELWQAISPASVARNQLLSDLGSDAPTGIPPKLSTTIPSYPQYRYRNAFQESLRLVSDLIIEDAPHTPELVKRFYEECYCDSGALQKEALLGKTILAARYSALFSGDKEAPVIENVDPRKGDSFGLSSDALAEALGRRPIVVIGDVGVGKTSFIRHLVHVRAEDEMRNAIFIYLDLGSQANLGQDIREFLLQDIERQLLESHGVDIENDAFVRGVYHGDLLRFERGIYGPLKAASPAQFLEHEIEKLSELISDRASHLKACIQHLSAGRRKQVVLCIDNADQRTFEDQQAAFLAAQEFAANWRALVLVSIRPKTYFASRNAGSASAYPQRVLAISPPRIDEVLDRRLRFSLELAEGRLPLENLDGVSIRLDSLATFLKALLYSLQHNRELAELLGNITGGNIREVLELVKGFIGSPNVDSAKIVRIMETDGKYVIPLHEFTKQALLGEYSHYDARSSIAFNLFDLRYPDYKEHFLSSIIVAFLNSDSPARTHDGFVPCERIIEELQDFGFVVDQVEHALRRLTNKKLIEATERVTFDEGLQGLVGEMPSAFRVTTIGVYHVTKWAPSFAYLDAMIVDTPILDEAIRSSVTSRIRSFSISDRYARAVDFRNYLSKAWTMLASTPSYFDWPTVLTEGVTSFESVRRACEAASANRAS